MSRLDAEKADLAIALKAEGVDGEALVRVSRAVALYVAAVVRIEREKAKVHETYAVSRERNRIADEQRMRDNAESAMYGGGAFGNAFADAMRKGRRG